MRIINSEHKLCVSCMKEHEINIIESEEQVTFKNIKVKFNANYEYCSTTDEYVETEDMIRTNNLAVKDAYRIAVGLLTSNEIKNIREKYNLSQKEFSKILDWSEATITRYENHQVQDRAHDDILRKIDSDPVWFMELLERSKERISPRLYHDYYQNINQQCIKKKNPYFYGSITIKVDFNEWSLVENNTDMRRCANKLYKAYALDAFSSFATPPLKKDYNVLVF